MSANPHRGEALLVVGGETLVIRPSFAALVAAEEELGPLFALVERASEGRLGLGEIAALFDHLTRDGRAEGIDRARIGEAIVEQGLVGVSPQLRVVLSQILREMNRPSPDPSRELEGRFGASALRLAGMAGRLLGWRPDEFWRATPAELAAMVQGEEVEAVAGGELAALMARFPDEVR